MRHHDVIPRQVVPFGGSMVQIQHTGWWHLFRQDLERLQPVERAELLSRLTAQYDARRNNEYPVKVAEQEREGVRDSCLPDSCGHSHQGGLATGGEVGGDRMKRTELSLAQWRLAKLTKAKEWAVGSEVHCGLAGRSTSSARIRSVLRGTAHARHASGR